MIAPYFGMVGLLNEFERAHNERAGGYCTCPACYIWRVQRVGYQYSRGRRKP